jgi:ABC-2 type transport system permease protein
MNWSKIRLIIHREYMTRVRTKAFIITTLLMPVFILVLVGIPILMEKFVSDDDTKRMIYVVDETQVLLPRLVESTQDLYMMAPDGLSEDSLIQLVLSGNINGYMFLDAEHVSNNDKKIQVLTDGTGGIRFSTDIRSDVRNAIYEERISKAEVSEAVQNIIKNRATVNVTKLAEDGGSAGDSTALFFLGYALAFIIYISLFVYGSIVMRGVIEEKTSRIVEVITSSVKPFELMLGKVLGVGMVGLTQFGVWILGTIIITAVIVPLITGGSSTADPQMAQAMEVAQNEGFGMPVISAKVWIVFILNFFFGYLLYSSLFAAVGSAVESETDTQQLSLPITIPIIIAIILMPQVTSSPESSLAVISSLIPFLSPVLMTARVSVIDVPFWQIGLSYVLMTVTFLACIVLAGKIYRVGILMYGKKAGFKELFKWIRYS